MELPPNNHTRSEAQRMAALVSQIRQWSRDLGFQQLGITDTGLSGDEHFLLNWLQSGYQGEMAWMADHGTLRSRPTDLVPGTLRIISVRMDYLPAASKSASQVLANPQLGYISRYALGRDYHKVMRHRLQKLADRIVDEIGPFGYRAFVDSAPVLEKALAQKAGLGWIGKHSNLLHRDAGSWFFLGELYTDLPLPIDTAVSEHCGDCDACITDCPTQAILGPRLVDARRCISYLTIELKGPIPVEFRTLMGNRIYGCDDCQLVCPWNRFAEHTTETDYLPRHDLDAPTLLDLFRWDEVTFLNKTKGSAIRRIGHERWLRNIAVALGNAPYDIDIIQALEARLDHASALVREHVVWALQQQTEHKQGQADV